MFPHFPLIDTNSYSSTNTIYMIVVLNGVSKFDNYRVIVPLEIFRPNRSKTVNCILTLEVYASICVILFKISSLRERNLHDYHKYVYICAYVSIYTCIQIYIYTFFYIIIFTYSLIILGYSLILLNYNPVTQFIKMYFWPKRKCYYEFNLPGFQLAIIY